MSVRNVNADAVLPSLARGAGTYTSGPIGIAAHAADALVMVHVSAISGTGATVAVSLEESANGTTWTAVAGSGVSLTAAGSATANAPTPGNFVRVSATVSGTTPSVTFRVACLFFME